MSVQLVLKNSSVQDKEATAAQLAVGELALNYHSSGPFLQCEDSAGNIWRLGGVVIASTAPSSPSKGAWWLDSDDNHLYFYDGSSWIEIQTGEIVPGDITEGTARQLLQTNAAGNGTEWTSNVDVPGTLDVTGVATFDNNVVITGNLTVNGTTTTIDTTTLVVEDKNIEMGAVGTPTDSTADGGGITLKGATDKTINWVNATDAWTSSERFSVPLGAQATPSLTFTGDANTGIYSPGADQVAISTGGTGRLFVDASGRVGVGTTSPQAFFHVQNDTTANTYAYIQNTTAGNAGVHIQNSDGNWQIIANANLRFRDQGNTTDRMVIDSSGRVGVGTSSPTDVLHINSSSTQLKLQSSSGVNNCILHTNGTTDSWRVGMNLNLTNGSYEIYDDVNNVDRMVITSGGNVGVGTTSPSYLLDVGGASQGTPTINCFGPTADNNWAGGIRFASNDGTTVTSTIKASSGGLLFDYGGSERLRIDSSGRVGIGTSSPGSILTVQASGTQQSLFSARANAGAGGGMTLQSDASDDGLLRLYDSAGAVKVQLDTDGGDNYIALGNVGIGTASPSSRLAVVDTSSNTTGAAGAFIDINNTDLNSSVVSGLRFKNGTTDSYKGAIYFKDTAGDARGDLVFATNNVGTASSEVSLSDARMTITREGLVGIGTTSPTTPLHVEGTSGSPALRIGNSAGTTNLQITANENNDITLQFRDGGSERSLVFSGITERMRIDSSGRLLVGTSTGHTLGGTLGNAQFSGVGTQVHLVSTSTSPSYINLAAGSSGTNVTSTTALGRIQFFGYHTNGYDTGARIEAAVDGTPGDGDLPTRLVFSTTADGASSPTERVRIEATGKTKFSGAAYGVENTITASAFDLNDGNLWTCGAIAIPNPTNAVAGLMGSIRVTAAPTSFGSNFDHPGGSYTAPTSFPAVAPFYCVSSTNILLGSWTQGIA